MKLQNKTFIHYGNDDLIKGIKYHNKPLDTEIIKDPDRASFMQTFINKQFNGLWSCEFTPNKEFNSAWSRFVHRGMVRSKNTLKYFFTFKIKDDSKILIIDSKEDILKLDPKYGVVKLSDAKKDISQKLMNTDIHSPEYMELMSQFFRCRDIMLLNPGTISEDFDGMFVSENAVSVLRDAFELWDVETLLIFNLDIIEVLTRSSDNV